MKSLYRPLAFLEVDFFWLRMKSCTGFQDIRLGTTGRHIWCRGAWKYLRHYCMCIACLPICNNNLGHCACILCPCLSKKPGAPLAFIKNETFYRSWTSLRGEFLFNNPARAIWMTSIKYLIIWWISYSKLWHWQWYVKIKMCSDSSNMSVVFSVGLRVGAMSTMPLAVVPGVAPVLLAVVPARSGAFGSSASAGGPPLWFCLDTGLVQV